MLGDLSDVIPLLAVAPWFIIGPIMSRRIQANTVAAVDTSLHNMAIAGS